MTWDHKKFSTLAILDGGNVSFGDNKKGKIIGVGSVGSKPKIDNVSLVEGLKFNLLSVSQPLIFC